MSEKSDKALAALNHDEVVTFTVPLKCAVTMIALAESNSVAEPYKEYIDSTKKQIAQQLSDN